MIAVKSNRGVVTTVKLVGGRDRHLNKMDEANYYYYYY